MALPGAGEEVVLELDQAEHVGIERGEDIDEFVRLARELSVVLAPRGSMPLAVCGGVERLEIVEHVEAADLEGAADIGGLRLARIGRHEGVVAVLDRADAPGRAARRAPAHW